MYAGTTKSVAPETPKALTMVSKQADACLADDIHIGTAPAAHPRVILLTGATGFLGRQVLAQLLMEDRILVICLVRARDATEARKRLMDSARCAGLDEGCVAARVEVVRGDLSEQSLGLDAEVYSALCNRVEAVFHCAAEVNWVRSYRQLRQSNVLGTLELIRFACAGKAKPFTFVSSLAVCFSRSGPTNINEDTDMLPWVDYMPLGYAQSKCVAEALLRSVAVRGLPVTIVRPGLLSGDSQTGSSNAGDIITALIGGCVEKGEAPDVDWQFDSVPVDYAARAAIALGWRKHCGLSVYHLRHRRPRHWRELVLWLNIFGYRVELLPKPDWIERCFGPQADRDSMLYGYRLFFRGMAMSADGQRPFEAYLSAAQDAVSCENTLRVLETHGVAEPPMDAGLLRRYVDYFARTGILPYRYGNADSGHATPSEELKLQVIQRTEQAPDAQWEELPFDASNGILNEIASIRGGACVGMRRYRVVSTGAANRSLDILLKTKVEDRVTQALVADAADLCDRELGRLMRCFPRGLGLDGAHLCEPAVHEIPSLSAYMPEFYGAVANPDNGIWSIAIEYLSDVELMDCAALAGSWTEDHRECAISGVAAVHAFSYGKMEGQGAAGWLASELHPAEVMEMMELWRALGRFAAPLFSACAGPTILASQSRCLEDIGTWWGELHSMPKALLHNDFNPRNLAFRRDGKQLRLCAFDWELARPGTPQQDLAELLCFVFPHDGNQADLMRYLEWHREALATNTGASLPQDQWIRGFRLSLQRLLIQKLPLYALAHRFKPQAFLPSVLANWASLFDLSFNLERTISEIT